MTSLAWDNSGFGDIQQEFSQILPALFHHGRNTLVATSSPGIRWIHSIMGQEWLIWSVHILEDASFKTFKFPVVCFDSCQTPFSLLIRFLASGKKGSWLIESNIFVVGKLFLQWGQ